MPLQEWSENIVLAELHDDPAFTDDVTALQEHVERKTDVDVVINFADVNYVNSSNLAKLLRLRKQVTITNQRKMVFCAVNTHVWGLFLTTGLTKTFDFADNVTLGLAGVQLGRADESDGDGSVE